ncbi:MAG: porin [Fimbriiglobus sp.]|jgi:hypothetical protein|nr:porin [Fimbriiglobus sp.]
MISIRHLAATLLVSPTLALAQPAIPAPAPVPTPIAPSVVPAPVVTLPASPADGIPAPAGEIPAAATPEAPGEPSDPTERFLVEKILGGTTRGQQLLENGWRIYGWTQGSFTTGSVRRSALPVPFIDRAEQFSLNQNWLHIEKAVDTSRKELQIGGAVDLILPGTDSRLTISRGLLDNQLGRTDYPIDLFQAYLDIFAPNIGPQGTTFRVGKFATFLEYETVQQVTSPFISRSYLFQYDPFTHTGALAITPLNDDVTVSNGIVMGNDNFFTQYRPTYIGQIRWAPKEGKSSIGLGVTVTNPRFDQSANFSYYNDYNLQFTHKLTDKLQYILDASFAHEDNVIVDGRLTSANWFGTVHYLLWDVTEKWQAKARVELFEDSKGIRTGTAGLYTAVTLGATWKPTPWLWVLPEVRYDNNNRGRPFEGNNNMFTASIGGLVRW